MNHTTEKTNLRRLGAEYEEKAAACLEKAGYRILEHNFRAPRGEIDLVAEEGGYLVFIEVKYRSSNRSGFSAEAVGPAKQKRILAAALYYLAVHRLPESTPVRFDVVAIDGGRVRLIRNAFGS